jgi:hypothetical protein
MALDPVSIGATVLSKILVDILQYFQAREDLKELVREEIRNAGLKSANDALGWKVDALGVPDGGATIRVHDGALQITLPGYSANPGSVTITPPVPTGPPAGPVPPAP